MEEKPAGANFKNLHIREYQGHKKKVHSVAWNCVGTKVASGSVDHTARVWNIDPHGHGKVKDVELKGHTDSVDQLCWDPKHAELVATAAGDKTVRLWDARSGKCSQLVELSGENINVTYNPDGTHIAVGNKEDELTILDVRKFKPIHRRKFNYEVNEIAWNTRGDLFFLTTGNGTVEVLSYPALKVQHTLMAHTAGCYCIAIDPMGRVVQRMRLPVDIGQQRSTSERRGLGLLARVASQRTQGHFAAAMGIVCALALRGRAQHPTMGEFVELWSSATPQCIVVACSSRSRGRSFAVPGGPRHLVDLCSCSRARESSDSSYFAVGSADSLSSLWDMKEMLCIRTFTNLQWPVRTVSFNYTGEYIASGSEDAYVDISDVQTGRSVYQIPCKAPMNSVEWNPKYNLLAYAGDDKNKYQADEGTFRIFGFESA